MEHIQIHDVSHIAEGDIGISVFGTAGKPIFTVPIGKTLVVETVSPEVSDIKGVNFSVSLRGSNGADLNFLLTTKGVFQAGSIPEKGRDAVTVSAKLIVNSGEELKYQFIRDVTTSKEVAGVSITVVGFLEDVP